MNRRGFFKALAATAVIAFAGQTRFAQTAFKLVEDHISMGRGYAEALAASLVETKEMLAANVMNHAFYLNLTPRLLDA